MKKYILTLLGSGLLLAAFSPANAVLVEPSTYLGLSFHRVSPNSNWAVSYAYEVIQILDLKNGGDPIAYTDMKVGVGNYVSNDGIVLASDAATDQAKYWKDGKWYDLTDGSYAMSFSNAITPDGSRIVGAVSPADFEGYNGLMLVPCYWDRQSDGTYQGPNLIPCPTTDLAGLKPQYVTGVYVSDDGKTVAGQMIEWKGDLAYPYVFRQAENGTWSYEFLIKNLFEGDGIVVPESPGEGPDPSEFMTAEKRAAYTKALNQWLLINSNTEWPDYSTYPDYEDYMTEEEITSYTKELRSWSNSYNTYIAKWSEYLSKVPNIGLNDLVMTADGKTYISSMKYKGQSGPLVINLEDRSYEFLIQNGVSPIVTSATNAGDILGYSTSWEVRQAYVIPAGEKSFIPLQDYITSINPQLGNWMQKNLYHDVLFGVEWDDELGTWIDHFFSGYATGMPFTNPDFSLIALSVEDDWNWQEDGALTVGYLFSTKATGGVESLVEENLDRIYHVYNLQGMKLLETKDISQVNNLPAGCYIVNGKKIVL